MLFRSNLINIIDMSLNLDCDKITSFLVLNIKGRLEIINIFKQNYLNKNEDFISIRKNIIEEER